MGSYVLFYRKPERCGLNLLPEKRKTYLVSFAVAIHMIFAGVSQKGRKKEAFLISTLNPDIQNFSLGGAGSSDFFLILS